MADSQQPKWTQWDIEQAWLDVVAARLKGDTEAEALGMRRFSEGLRNSALGAAGAVLVPLDEKIDKLTTLFRNARNADLDWRTEESERREAGALYIEEEFRRLGEDVRSLGGLAAKVEDHEVRITSLEEHGAPAEAVNEIHLVNKRVGRLELWVAFLTIAIALNALIYLILTLSPTGGGR